MTQDSIRAAFYAALHEIAPELDPATLRPDDDLRETADLDSVDFLNLVVALHDSLGVDVPEADYPRMRTLAGCMEYLGERIAERAESKAGN